MPVVEITTGLKFTPHRANSFDANRFTMFTSPALYNLRYPFYNLSAKIKTRELKPPSCFAMSHQKDRRLSQREKPLNATGLKTHGLQVCDGLVDALVMRREHFRDAKVAQGQIILPTVNEDFADHAM